MTHPHSSDRAGLASDRLKEKWACIACNTTFPAGEMRNGTYPCFRCPNCNSEPCYPADGQVRSVPVYVGEIGTRN